MTKKRAFAALMVLVPIAAIAWAGLDWGGRTVPAGPIAPTGPSGPPPEEIGPKAVLLQTPEAIWNTAFEVSVAFSPDGRTVAIGRLGDRPAEGKGDDGPPGSVVTIIDVATGRELLTIRGPFVEAGGVAFSPTGDSLAVGGDRGVVLYDPATGRDRGRLPAPSFFEGLALAYSGDGQRLAAATIDGDLVVWDTNTRSHLTSFHAHTRSLRGVAISPDGRLAASASDGPIVCHYEGRYGLPAWLSGVGMIGCGPDYGVIRLVDVATGVETASLKLPWRAYSASFSPDGRALAVGGGGTARLWDMADPSGRTLLTVEPELDVYCVAFAPDGQTLAIGVGSRQFNGEYGEVRLWDMKTGRVRAILTGEMGMIRSLAFAPDGKSLVTGSRDAVVLWGVPPASPTVPGSLPPES